LHAEEKRLAVIHKLAALLLEREEDLDLLHLHLGQRVSWRTSGVASTSRCGGEVRGDAVAVEEAVETVDSSWMRRRLCTTIHETQRQAPCGAWSTVDNLEVVHKETTTMGA